MEQERIKLEEVLKTVQDIECKLQQKLSVEDDIKRIIAKIDNIEFIQKAKTRCKEYLQNFDNECKTNSIELIKVAPLLLAIYEDFIQLLIQPTTISKQAEKELGKVNEELRNTLDNIQKELLEQVESLSETMADEREIQAYLYGYVMATVERKETSIKY